MVQSQCLNAPFFFLVRVVCTGCVLLDLSRNMSLRRSTKVDGEKNRKIRFRNGMCLKRKNVERKNDRPISVRSKNDLFLFPTEGMIGVVAYLVTCWPDCGKKIEVCTLRNGNRTEEKWNFLR